MNDELPSDVQPDGLAAQAPYAVRPHRIDGKPPPLGGKRVLLLERRLSSPARSCPVCAEDRSVYIADDQVAFKLKPVNGGLLIERRQLQPWNGQLIQTLLVTDSADFGRWNEREPARFDAPTLYDRLCRQGHELLAPR